jgi:hypothetical protein
LRALTAGKIRIVIGLAACWIVVQYALGGLVFGVLHILRIEEPLALFAATIAVMALTYAFTAVVAHAVLPPSPLLATNAKLALQILDLIPGPEGPVPPTTGRLLRTMGDNLSEQPGREESLANFIAELRKRCLGVPKLDFVLYEQACVAAWPLWMVEVLLDLPPSRSELSAGSEPLIVPDTVPVLMRDVGLEDSVRDGQSDQFVRLIVSRKRKPAVRTLARAFSFLWLRCPYQSSDSYHALAAHIVRSQMSQWLADGSMKITGGGSFGDSASYREAWWNTLAAELAVTKSKTEIVE